MSVFHEAATLAVGLAWPLVVAMLGLVFRSELVGLLRRVEEFKLPGVAAKLRDEVGAAERLAASAVPEVPDDTGEAGSDAPAVPSGGTDSERDGDGPGVRRNRDFYATTFGNLIERADREPLASVVLAWQVVEETARRAAVTMDLRPHASVRVTVESMARRELLDSELVQVARQLSTIRNEVVHDRDVAKTLSGDVATNFVLTAQRLVYAMRLATRAARSARRPDAEDGAPRRPQRGALDP